MNPDLKKRWEASTHRRLKDMLDSYSGEGSYKDHIPTHRNGKPACLSWHLKGYCSDDCQRKDCHLPTGADMVTAFHGLLDSCGVAQA